MSWNLLPAHLEKQVHSEISMASKLVSNKTRKFRNNRPYAYGRTWDSDKELARYEDLLLLEKAGEIKDLTVQPKFEIVAAIKSNGFNFQTKHYIADFSYFCKNASKTIIEDVKSEETSKIRVYRLKIHLLLSRYSDITFREYK